MSIVTGVQTCALPIYIHPQSSLGSATLSCCKTSLDGSTGSGRYLQQSCESRHQCRTCLKSISTIDLPQWTYNQHWWDILRPSFLGFATLSRCKTSLDGSRGSGRWLHQNCMSRDQCRTFLKSIPTIDLPQSIYNRHWWNIYPPFFSSPASSCCYKTSLDGSRGSGRWLHQNCMSRDQCRTFLKSIPTIDLPHPGYNQH